MAVIGYGFIKQLKKKLGCRIRDLLVEDQANDPFYADLPSHRKMAEWFAKLWQDFGSPKGVHLRGLHYRLISQENPKKHTGETYKNTDSCWNYLVNAAKYARYLSLVPLDAIVDRRNPEPKICMFNNYMDTPGWEPEFVTWDLPQIDFSLDDEIWWRLPGFSIFGYNYHHSLQPYHVEVWVEKSTMNDVLAPICDKYGVNLITGLGFMSIPSVVDLLKRVAEIKKPTRILYVSDFDPGGKGMPTSVARQIEYWLHNKELWLDEDIEIDIKLEPIVLTKEQIKRYHLPRTPIKDTDKRKKNFEEKYGEGAVELDALEALYPGELAKIVTEHILQFRDMNLPGRVDDARDKLEERLDDEWKDKILPYKKRLENIKEQVKGVLEKYKQELRNLNDQLMKDLEPFGKKLKTLWQEIQNRLDEIDIYVPPLPDPETKEDKRNWFFDSSRDYLEQLRIYKEKR